MSPVLRRARALATATLLVALAGCLTDAQRARAYITSEGQVVFMPAPCKPGETLIRIENDDAAKRQPVLIRLDPQQPPNGLSTHDGKVAVGNPGDLEYHGPGYRVIGTLDTMRPFYGGDQRVVQVMHVYLAPGRYVLLSNRQGDYASGVWTSFSIGRCP